jgi:hypothetical protein
MEVHSKVSRSEISRLLNEAFTNAGMNHRSRAAGYHHSTDSSNTSLWEVKTDSSITGGSFSIPARIRREYVHSAEIVSPVLSGDDGMKALEIVCGVLNPICDISRNCGLHVHHEVTEAAGKVKNLINAWIDNEDHFFKAVPRSRSQSSYCKSWRRAAGRLRKMGSYDQIRGWYRQHRFGRHVGLNLESYFLRGTFEFRLAAGTTEFKKVSNWVLVTQNFISKGLQGKIKNNNTIDELITNLKGKAIRLRSGSRPSMLYSKVSQEGLTYSELFEDVELLAKYDDNKTWIKNDFNRLFNNEYNQAADWMKERSELFA